MEPTSFNLLVLNLMIGLFKHNPLYGKLTEDIKNLEYYIGGIERGFVVGRRLTTPEIMACSEAQGHTVLVESTFADGLNTKKRAQITNYLQVTGAHLAGMAGIPVMACGMNTTWVIVRPQGIASYQDILLIPTPNAAVLSAFYPTKSGYYRLERHGGAFQDSGLDGTIKQHHDFNRIYEGYVTIPTDDPSDSVLAGPVTQVLVSFAFRRKTEFASEDVVRELIPIFDEFDTEKQASVISIIDNFLKRARRKSTLEEMLRLEIEPERKWVIALPDDKPYLSNVARFSKAIGRYVSEITGSDQLTLEMN